MPKEHNRVTFYLGGIVFHWARQSFSNKLHRSTHQAIFHSDRFLIDLPSAQVHDLPTTVPDNLVFLRDAKHRSVISEKAWSVRKYRIAVEPDLKKPPERATKRSR